jgi:Zn-finger nucleic acid-binding protein
MNGPTQALTCPKCGGQMRSYERNGVTVDQCTECRGIFLDRGELERLVDAENSHYEREYSDRDRDRGYEDRPPRDRDDDRHYEDKRGHKPKKSKKKSFLENLMEGIGE